jgi:predicted GNAT family acetyltransferase
MAQRGGDTPNSTRLNLVFTKRASRGKGYAAACVAAVSQAVFDSGKRFACLNADLANATSNALYLRLGYRPVCDLDEWDLSM